MRVSVPLRHAYKLLNHGPTTLLTSAAEGRENVMPAAWVMPLDLEPPKVAAVIGSDSYTRELLEKSGELVINVPCARLAAQTYAAGQVNGHGKDKLRELGFATSPASAVKPPLIDGCVAWLECRVLPEPKVREQYDLVLLEVVAAWADGEVFVDSEWRFEGHPDKRTLHHISKGVFLLDGERLDVQSKR